jgi:uncharacterized protein
MSILQKSEIINYLKEYKKLHLEDYSIKKLGLFGSVARGESTESSDLDIVVEFTKPNLFIQAGIMEELKDFFKVDVDVIALSKHTNPKLLKRINKDVIYV